MTDYQKMYTTLFNAITDAIHILQKAQQSVEEAYVNEDTQTLAPTAQDSADESDAE